MEEKKQILQEFVTDMEKVFDSSLKKIILYGSYARGDFKINSDMDIMILISLSDNEIKVLERSLGAQSPSSTK